MKKEVYLSIAEFIELGGTLEMDQVLYRCNYNEDTYYSIATVSDPEKLMKTLYNQETRISFDGDYVYVVVNITL